MGEYNILDVLAVDGRFYQYYSLRKAQEQGSAALSSLPRVLKILLENVLRHQSGDVRAQQEYCRAFEGWSIKGHSTAEIPYYPSRVLMQDFTGVPAVVDLAAMRDAMFAWGGDPNEINPQCAVDLVIDHSLQVDHFGSKEALEANIVREIERNAPRYSFLHWGQQAFKRFRVVPPGRGICHQINLEFLATVVSQEETEGACVVFPDTVVGTDSHTTMINGLGVLGWGVGGIEAESAMLGQPMVMRIPEVVGVELVGALKEGVTATDLVLMVTERLRKHGVVGKLVEFFGQGLPHLSLEERATIANMAPEYGATCGFFPIDSESLRYLRLTHRSEEQITLVEAYAKAQGLWFTPEAPLPIFSDTVTIDLSAVEPSLAGPKRPQDRVALPEVRARFDSVYSESVTKSTAARVMIEGQEVCLKDGAVLIAAITSCTNTSNPAVLLAAALLAKKAVDQGLVRQPWVKTSLAPGSKVVIDYLQAAGLLPYLEQLGFHLVGYGCATCIGNAGPLLDAVESAVLASQLVGCAVLSGNRNFEGRIHPLVGANWLASPPLVVAYALAGTVRIDLQKDPLGHNAEGQAVYLKDIWPTSSEVAEYMSYVSAQSFQKQYADIFLGDADWQRLVSAKSVTYDWSEASTYIKPPPFFHGIEKTPHALCDIDNARILLVLGNSITTDHISPAGSIPAQSPAGLYLQAHGVAVRDFNSYGARRGNHEVMLRGTFNNIRIRNEMLEGVEGGLTRHYTGGEPEPVYNIAMRYKEEGTPLVVIAGKDYGMGSSRDWAAKGTLLLGVRAVIAESFERIHRSNLIGMGVLPLVFMEGTNRKTLKLSGTERIDIVGLASRLLPQQPLRVVITRQTGASETITVLCGIQTDVEADYYHNGGVLPYVLRNFVR